MVEWDQKNKRNKMFVIGLTGGVACGKSLASTYLKEKGFAVIDCDELNRKLQLTHPLVHLILKENFPLAFDNGKLNRKKLAQLVYQSEEGLSHINHLMLPFIIKEIQSELCLLEQSKTPVVFIDAPLLFENEIDKFCQKTICVYIEEEIFKERFLKRPDMTPEIFKKVILAQFSIEEKKKRADVTILSDNKKDFFDRIDLFLNTLN